MLIPLHAAVSTPEADIRAVTIRTPVAADKAAIEAAYEEALRDGRELSDAAQMAIIVAQLVDLPVSVVRKFGRRDLWRAAEAAIAAFRDAGFE